MLYLHVVQQRQVMGPQVCRPIQPLLACNDQRMTASLGKSVIDDYTVSIDLHLRVLVSVPTHVGEVVRTPHQNAEVGCVK